MPRLLSHHSSFQSTQTHHGPFILTTPFAPHRYVKTHYTAPRMVIAGSGAVTHDQLCDLSSKAFDKLPTTPASDLVLNRDTVFTGSDARFEDPEATETHFALAFPTVGWSDPDSVTFMVMQSLLGSWDRTTGAGLRPTPTSLSSYIYYDATTHHLPSSTFRGN